MPCNYPDCDGGPATGYCHRDCRFAQEKPEPTEEEYERMHAEWVSLVGSLADCEVCPGGVFMRDAAAEEAAALKVADIAEQAVRDFRNGSWKV